MIGAAISTHKRPDILARALTAWAAHMPDVLVVNHDHTGAGVAVTKNAGIAALMNAGCDHLFLVDDDTWPRTPNWWQPYVESPVAHLMYLRPAATAPYDNRHVSRRWPNGPVLYYQRHVINRVGGMRTAFGRYGSEHGEHSRRIHNAGLTPAPFLGLACSRDLWHALDYEEPGTESTVGRAERDTTYDRRQVLRKKYAKSAEFVDYGGA